MFGNFWVEYYFTVSSKRCFCVLSLDMGLILCILQLPLVTVVHSSYRQHELLIFCVNIFSLIAFYSALLKMNWCIFRILWESLIHIWSLVARWQMASLSPFIELRF